MPRKPAVAPPDPVSGGVVVLDAMTAKHGHKRFSELFDLYRNHKTWSEDQKRRMATEAGLFIELMDDPPLAEIEVETIHEYASRLSRLPTDIYLARRRLKVESLRELTEIAVKESLPLKNKTTVRGHVGRIAEVLNYGVKPAGMLRVNPAAGFKRDWSVGKKVRAQDERDEFTADELASIFSSGWFAMGAGEFSAKGWTDWRPFYYWLPLLALATGSRLNELAQLYLDDVCQSEKDSQVWYLDFNLDQDKVNADGDFEPDKSLKTINAVRVVPLPDFVIKAGLPEYVAALRKAGHVRLFPELKRDKVKGYGKPAGSWFNERFLGERLGIERNGRKTFHSFRHNFTTAVERLDPPIAERVINQLTGHERGNTQSMKRYAKDRNATELKPVIDRLMFPCLSGVGKFNVSAAMKALKCAERFKAAVARGREASGKV